MNGSEPVTYVAIGDSLTKGTGSLFSAGFVKCYQGLIAEHLQCRVNTAKFAKSGAESTQILQKMKSQRVQEAVQQASIITISAGGNDLLYAGRKYLQSAEESLLRDCLLTFRHNMKAILALIKQIKAEHEKYMVILVNLYNPYPELPVADPLIRQLNGILNKLQDDKVLVCDVYTAIQGSEQEYLCFDGLHPNGRGHKRIADEIGRLGFELILS